MFQCKINKEGYETKNGRIVVYWDLKKQKPETLDIPKINEILSRPLVFGNREQIHALKAWAVLSEYSEREHQDYSNRSRS